MPRTYPRAERVERLAREVLGEALQDLKDPRIGFVTVTGVETSADLRTARVFVSILGGAPEREAALAGLHSASGFLQQRVGRELRMKRTPTLTFVHDDSIDTGMRITELLTEVEPGGGE